MTSGKQSLNLSGFWTGVYDYPNAFRQPVPFNAVIEDVAGALGGEIIEPNTFSSAKDRELFASLSGSREGNAVHFIKTYEQVPRGGHSIVYEGTLDATGTKIEGNWRSTRPNSSWSGPFVMNRSNGKTAKKEEKIARSRNLAKTA
jgi:hypothetical protein